MNVHQTLAVQTQDAESSAAKLYASVCQNTKEHHHKYHVIFLKTHAILHLAGQTLSVQF